MVTLADLGTKIYLDTNIFIYVVEGHPTYAQPLMELFERLELDAVQAVTSELTIAEVLVKPLIDNRSSLVETYKSLLGPGSGIQTLPIDRNTLLLSSQTRAQFGGRAFDAIHVATAMMARCSCFITNDASIRGPVSLRFVHLSEFRA